MIISPWHSDIVLVSPDGEFEVRLIESHEIAMGAPTSGKLVLPKGEVVERCNPSIVWSDNSEYLAVPQWTRTRMQRLLVISMSRNTTRYAPDEYRVLQLERFEKGVITGVDSPIHLPRPLSFEIANLVW